MLPETSKANVAVSSRAPRPGTGPQLAIREQHHEPAIHQTIRSQNQKCRETTCAETPANRPRQGSERWAPCESVHRRSRRPVPHEPTHYPPLAWPDKSMAHESAPGGAVAASFPGWKEACAAGGVVEAGDSNCATPYEAILTRSPVIKVDRWKPGKLCIHVKHMAMRRAQCRIAAPAERIPC